jgi:hypothetical protein
MEAKALIEAKLVLEKSETKISSKKQTPHFWLRKSNKGYEPILIKWMDQKYIHTAIKLVKENTKLPSDLFGNYTREEWLNSLKNELDRRNGIDRVIGIFLSKTSLKSLQGDKIILENLGTNKQFIKQLKNKDYEQSKN